MNTAAAPGLTGKQAARRQRLLDAALTLLGERDYERIQVREIAEAARVAVATLYHYFPSKEHLFAEVLVRWAADLGTDVTRRPLAATTPAGRLEETLHRSLRAFERRPQLARLLGHLETSEDPFARQVLDRLDSATRDVYLSQLADLDPDDATRVVRVVGAVLDSALRALSSGRRSARHAHQLVSDTVRLVLPEGTQRP